MFFHFLSLPLLLIYCIHKKNTPEILRYFSDLLYNSREKVVCCKYIVLDRKECEKSESCIPNIVFLLELSHSTVCLLEVFLHKREVRDKNVEILYQIFFSLSKIRTKKLKESFSLSFLKIYIERISRKRENRDRKIFSK